MTANMYILRNEGLENKRLVFHMGHITEIVKSKELIRARIIDVFRDFDVTEDEIRAKITFTTDR